LAKIAENCDHNIDPRYSSDDSDSSIGYWAHIGGGAAGFLIGMNVLRNFEHEVDVNQLDSLEFYKRICLMHLSQ
jgi:hypothetical protein